MKINTLISILSLCSFSAFSACNFDVDFTSIPQVKEQKVELSADATLYISQQVAKKLENGAVIATNVTCQHLVGQPYQLGEEYWQHYLDNAVKGLGKAGVTSLDVTIVGKDDWVYKGPQEKLEYVFDADFGGNKQEIRNLAVMIEETNSLVSFSVSGNQVVKSAIEQEFKRVVGSFKVN